MLHTKFPDDRANGSGEEILKGFTVEPQCLEQAWDHEN